MKFLSVLGLLVLLLACKAKNELSPVTNRYNRVEIDTPSPKTIIKENLYSPYEESLIEKGFHDITKIDGIKVELPYSTIQNFTSEILYDSLQHAFLREIAYKKLEKAQSILAEENPDFYIIVFDAFRPNAVQKKMWEIVKGTPMQKYVAHPTRGSIHNFGLAVDCSIYDSKKDSLLDMGTTFDHLGYEAEYRFNNQLVKNGIISQAAKENRELLRQVMKEAGFLPINSEWWHFNALSKEETRAMFSLE